MSDLLKAVMTALLPDGATWDIRPNGDFDKLLDGQAENFDFIRDFLDGLAVIRSPDKTPILTDLEKEYGILTNFNLSDSVRRLQLSSRVFTRGITGSDDNMQAALNDAAFIVQVHENSPAVDPSIFLDDVFQMVAGGDNAFAGRTDAVAGRLGGELVVNGDIFSQKLLIDMHAASPFAFAGNSKAVAGQFSSASLITEQIVPPIPVDPDAWPMIFFVGGDAIRDGVTGELLEIAPAQVPIERREELRRVILKYKPMHSWCGLIIEFT